MSQMSQPCEWLFEMNGSQRCGYLQRAINPISSDYSRVPDAYLCSGPNKQYDYNRAFAVTARAL